MNNYIFVLDENQIKKFETWKDDQMKIDSFMPLAGERFSLKFTTTGLGVIIIGIDEHLNEEIDLTDYESFS